MTVASDYDGVYDHMPAEKRAEVDFIITGRNWDRYEDMKDESNIDIPIFFNPGKGELMDIVSHKANIINKTGADVFYEDQKPQVEMLKLLCPKTKIIQYG